MFMLPKISSPSPSLSLSLFSKGETVPKRNTSMMTWKCPLSRLGLIIKGKEAAKETCTTKEPRLGRKQEGRGAHHSFVRIIGRAEGEDSPQSPGHQLQGQLLYFASAMNLSPSQCAFASFIPIRKLPSLLGAALAQLPSLTGPPGR